MGKFRKNGSKHEHRSGGKIKTKKPKGAKRDKIHGKAAGASGIAAQYITRAQAMRKLQVSLADFRRLCILKGIYPRDPKKKPGGKNLTYYHVKDIRFLNHEPLLNKFFNLTAWLKKYNKAVGRGDMDVVKHLEKEGKPQYTLQHLVRERYPSFADAIRDLDDCLSTVSLFDCLAGDEKREIRADVIQESTALLNQWLSYLITVSTHEEKKEENDIEIEEEKEEDGIAETTPGNGLQKVFASIKGYYFQASIDGETVTWLAPHKYAQALPMEVDFRVLGTFNEFYRTMLKFINFRLYKEMEVPLPEEKISADLTKCSSSNPNPKGLKKKSASSLIFQNLKVLISREVVFQPIFFVLKCGGASIVMDERKAGKGGITHVICDRPSIPGGQKPGVEYVQPQWVLDSFNKKKLLPVAAYGVGAKCPPHLSPFEEQEEEEEEVEKKESEKKEEEEELERRKAMMPKKYKRLLQRIEKGENEKKDEKKKLKDKKAKLGEVKKS